MRTKRNVAV